MRVRKTKGKLWQPIQSMRWQSVGLTRSVPVCEATFRESHQSEVTWQNPTWAVTRPRITSYLDNHNPHERLPRTRTWDSFFRSWRVNYTCRLCIGCVTASHVCKYMTFIFPFCVLYIFTSTWPLRCLSPFGLKRCFLCPFR